MNDLVKSKWKDYKVKYRELLHATPTEEERADLQRRIAAKY